MDDFIRRSDVLSKAASVAGCFSDMVSVYDIAAIPSCDVVAVVRCGECVHRLRGGYCKTVTDARATKPVNDNFFCSYGERRLCNG